MARYDTVANIVSDAAKELGLITATIADPYASSDQNVVQLLALLTSMGQEVLRTRRWTYLSLEYSFPTVNGVSLYNMPADYRGMVDQTGWNRTSRFPLDGPASPQEWQFLKALPSSQTLTVIFRPRLGQMEIYPPPGATVLTIAFEYLTTFWVAATGTTTPAKDAPTDKADVILFDRLLVVRALKLAWKREKGFESTAAQQDMDMAWDSAAEDDSPARVLNLGKRSSIGVHLLDDGNVPFTGFGQ